jgi:DNA-binding NtrC family response regulator
MKGNDGLSSLPHHNILLVEDDEAHAELIQRAFESNGNSHYDLRSVGTLDAAREALGSDDVDLVLTDFLLPDGRGTDLLKWPEVEALPVVVLTSHGDESVAVEAMKAGALDYVVKSPETFNRMPHIADRSLREWNHISERHRLERELRQSQKLEAVGRLSSGIAHDFNNLLMAIIGCSELALRKLEEDHPARKFVEAVRDSANRGSSLSNQLVTFSRKKEVAPEVFELNEMVEQSRRLMQPLLGEQIVFKMRLDERELNTLCDRSQLEQVVLNLVVNARDAMPEGGAITLSTGVRDVEDSQSSLDPGTYVTLSVSDEGVGMSQETISRAFEPFFTTKPVGKGTGLGLSTAYGIVKQADGDIVIDSEPGEGTSITISLPMVESEVMLDEGGQPTEEIPTGSERILLVEDDELVRLTMASYLEQGGYTVLEAEDGLSALAAVRNDVDGIDLIISDVMLPGKLDGPSAADQIRALGYDIPSLLVSAHSADQLVEDGRVEPGRAVLRKPVTESELLTHVRKVLDERDVAGGEPKVLFVEDHELSRTTTSMLLEDAGFVTREAASGADALSALAEEEVDAVIVDLGLPDVAGAELVQQLRAIDPDLPALFVSGRDAGDPAVQEALELARTDFLPKPFDFEELEAILRRLLGS